MSKKLIYTISGKARHGKNTVADILKEYYEGQGLKVCTIPFAKYLKQYAKDFFGWNGEEGTKPRKLLQELGTDKIREEMGMPLFHVGRICEDINILKDYFDVFLIPDARFPNEIYYTKAQEQFEVISMCVFREGFESELTSEQKSHRSETALDTFDGFDIVVSAKTIPELKERVLGEI